MKPLFYFITLLLAPSFATSQGIELVVPRYHNGSIISLDLSADGKFLISAGDDNTIFLREASTGNYLREFEEKAKVKAIKFLADSKHFIIQTSNGIAIRDIGNQGVKQQLDGEFDWIIASTLRNEFLAKSDNVITQYTEIRNVFKLTRTIHAGPGGLRSCSYSDDGQKLVINDGTIRLYDFLTGKFTPVNLKSIKPDSIQSMALSKNNFTLAIGLKNGVVKFFDLKNNLVVDSLKLFQTYWSGQYSKGIVKDSIVIRYPVRKLFFTGFGQLVAYYSGTVNNEDFDPGASGYVNPLDLDRMWDNLQKELDGRRTTPNQLIALWDVVQRRAKYLEQNTEYDYPFALRNDQIASKKGVQNYVTREKMIYEGANSKVAKAKFSSDGGKLLVDVNEKIRIWNLVTGSSYLLDHKLLRRDHFDTHRNFIGVDDYYNSGNPALLDMDAVKIDRQLKVNGYGVSLNSNKTQLAFNERDTVSVVDFSNKKLLYHEYLDRHYSYSFSEDGMFFISGNTILNSEGYSRIDSIPAEHQYGIQPVFIPDHHRLFFMNAGNIIIARDYASRVNTDTLTCFYGNENEIVIDKHFHPTYDLRKDELTRSEITAMDASPDKKTLALAFSNGLIVLIDPNDLRIIKTLPASAGAVKSIDFSPDGRFLIATSADGSIRFWDLKNYEVIAKILFYGKDWVVVNHNNLFDGSAGGLAKLFFINGLQTIELNQLKTRYYEPGLLKKITRGEKLRNVLGFNSVELPPEIRVGQVDKKGNLPIEVINRGGGIGEVALYINGKEAIKDLRKPGSDEKGAAQSFSIPIISNKSLIPGTENFLAVKAWNAGQWIESRGMVVKYLPPTRSEIKPSIHILVCGVSDYTGDEIDLKYAAKDAEEISRALELGAKRLFGIDKSHLHTLTTSQKQNLYPTKTNILKAFEQISATASSADVFVVYLSGHGINLGGSSGDFHYLTQDAFTANADAYNDPAIKQQTTLSSQELVELFKKVPALKQVLIIDACASGKVVDNLIAKRDIESSTLRALDRMKDRTGMHIITGCTADAVSYEASRYGQGVLTYSLLEGLRGLALREEKFVDVSQLFQFAQERVPVLASGIGGIQTPQVFSPNGSQSFDFGELTTEEKKQIPLAKARPIYIRSNFIDEQKLRDILGLGKKINEMLNDVAARGETSPLLFVDVSEYPDGCQLSGSYKQAEGKIILRLNKICEGRETFYDVEAKDEKELAGKIMALF